MNGDEITAPGTAACIARLLDRNVCRSALHVSEAGSTNTLALQELAGAHASAGEIDTLPPLPRLIIADSQTAGRGRRGRSWLSSSGSLTFSLIVELPAEISRYELYSLAAGVGVARAVEFDFAPLCPRLKWPNDVYLGGGKVAGILCEANQSAPDRLVIGIGMNVTNSPELRDQPAAAKAASIAAIVGRTVDRDECLESVVTQVLKAVQLAEHDRSELIAAFRSRCLLTGHEIACTIQGQPMRGRCLGVTDEGQLAVQTTHGVVPCHSGEATLVRPLP